MRATAVFFLSFPTLLLAAHPLLSGTIWKHLVFLDEFNGPAGSRPNASKWIIDTGTQYSGSNAPAQWGTGEIQSYTTNPANVQLSGQGELVITALKDANGAWTSGRIETVRSNFVCAVNGKMRIEARIMMPDVSGNQALGYWPAFWMLGQAYRNDYTNWPGIGEFDIMENVNGLNSVSSGLHCGTYPGGYCNEPSGLTVRSVCPTSNCSPLPGNYHTYTLVVNRYSSPESLIFYIDGAPTHSVLASSMDSATWKAAVHDPHYLLLNVAMGGAYPDALNGGVTTPTVTTVQGMPMKVDYVAIWKTNPGVGIQTK